MKVCFITQFRTDAASGPILRTEVSTVCLSIEDNDLFSSEAIYFVFLMKI